MYNKTLRILTVFFAFLVASNRLLAAESFISFSPQPGALSLRNATVGYSEEEYDGVKMAVQRLREDMSRVLGFVPMESADRPTILIGTLGRNKQLDQFPLNELRGKREMFVITTIGEQLIIAGSDRRGTIYGIYELSRQLGVSPWYWWADAPVVPRSDA